jgi:hypothetical protein
MPHISRSSGTPAGQHGPGSHTPGDVLSSVDSSALAVVVSAVVVDGSSVVLSVALSVALTVALSVALSVALDSVMVVSVAPVPSVPGLVADSSESSGAKHPATPELMASTSTRPHVNRSENMFGA